MSNLRFRIPTSAVAPRQLAPRHLAHGLLGAHLVHAGIITQLDLYHALALQRRMDAPLGDILVSEGLITPAQRDTALARQYGTRLVDLNRTPPDATLAARLPACLCLRYHVLPWLAVGNTLLVATNRPDRFAQLRACMGPQGATLIPVFADHHQIQTHLGRLYGTEFAHRAATRVPARDSCRGWEARQGHRSVSARLMAAAFLFSLILAPMAVLAALILCAVITLAMSTVLKAAALIAQSRPPPQPAVRAGDQLPMPFRLPRVSVLVPLLREKEIASALLCRLAQLTYPKSLLDVVLVLEAEDNVTRATIARTDLPPWINVIEVPAGNSLTTKPRALNYALEFCRGSIVGVWDAEDMPEPDQIEQVVTRFHDAPENVACLQGMLDYYNPRANWIARCFAIEYATWWRVMLPGVARLGLVIPLGGTTLFFRRSVLDRLGGWDAHNVTEDADLGLRLARRGYVTELLPTTTFEEANCRAWPWVRQRSRWLKGYFITWCVHMRDPAQLMRDLGPLRFCGVQAMFLATFSQFALMPLLWSFWLLSVGLPHPSTQILGAPVLWTMFGVFILSETLNLFMAAVAVAGRNHRHLMGWVLTMPFYFPMGALAAWKGLYEFVTRPFYWDKTAHGITPAPPLPSAVSRPARAAPPPA